MTVDGIPFQTWPDPGLDLPSFGGGWDDLPCDEENVPDGVPERDGLWIIRWGDDGCAHIREVPEPASGPN